MAESPTEIQGWVAVPHSRSISPGIAEVLLRLASTTPLPRRSASVMAPVRLRQGRLSSAASHMVMRGASLSEVKEIILGRTTLAMTASVRAPEPGAPPGGGGLPGWACWRSWHPRVRFLAPATAGGLPEDRREAAWASPGVRPEREDGGPALAWRALGTETGSGADSLTQSASVWYSLIYSRSWTAWGLADAGENLYLLRQREAR